MKTPLFSGENNNGSKIKNIYDNILKGQQSETVSGLQTAIDAGLPPGDILNDGMVDSMAEVGRLFEEGEYFVPEMLIAAGAMQSGLALLKPHLIEADIESAGTVAIGTVKGDLHDIGKNLVGMMLEGAGFEIIDLGTDVSPEQFVEAINGSNIDIVGLSALLTTTMPSMKATIDALESAGIRDQVNIMIGGAPVTGEYSETIGADGYAAGASKAVSLAKSLVGKN
jgi:5-methyltetrahydrofolate--homocysteine methyltransferase